MRTISQGTADYVAMKKAMGFSFYSQDMKLKNFCNFMKMQKQKKITLELAKIWALSGVKKPTWGHAKNLSILRAFAVYWKTIDPKTELWPENIWPIRYKRKNPYIYTNEEIQLLLRTCDELRPLESLRPLTFSTLFGLIATCGLRLSEAVTLQKSDVDLKNGVITIKRTKFNKMRIIPIDQTTVKILIKYELAREKFCKEYLSHHVRSTLFFISNDETPISNGVADWTFDKIALKCGVRKESRRGPRLHDLRHTFVVRTLEDWYRQGKNVEVFLPILSTYVGHSQPGSTYWYMSITPELMSLASERMDQYMGGLTQ